MNRLIVLFLLFSAGIHAATPEDFLPPEQAFQVSSRVVSPDTIALAWKIADDCYLYRHRFKIESVTPGIKVAETRFPAGENKTDHIFGEVEIFKKDVDVEVVLQRIDPAIDNLKLTIVYQGCAESGMCYMPENKTVEVRLPAISAMQRNSPAQPKIGASYTSEQDEILLTLNNKPPWFVILSFFGFGLLLAFTPCVFPMLPIISGIIAGQGRQINSRKAFGLSFCYVLASALTYTVFGVIAGLFGSNLQAFLQTPWVIATFSGLFVLLAMPMFGLFELQMPAFLQTKFVADSAHQRGGSFWGASVMGVFSALIIGPCVTAPLAGALLYISQTGDAVLGGAALFSLGCGMGTPLLFVGTFAGKLLPKAGAWMESVKSFFGLGLLAVAIGLLSRILPPAATLILWLLLATLPVFLLLRKRRWRLAGFTGILYGCLLWLGFSGHFSKEIPALVCSAVEACEASLQPTLAFKKVSTVAELQAQLDTARRLHKPAILDFYADWCTSCVELKHNTFSEPSVHNALTDTVLIQADVTQHTEADKALLKQFNLIGPPAILFFSPERDELSRYRIIGYVSANELLNTLSKAFLDSTSKLGKK
ncbi:MAG: protein-disulfide reductase DsbD [Methylococcaceae bacterium]|nr:protein-disulfide reductase DsbD [Methylococcaceae bacterium]